MTSFKETLTKFKVETGLSVRQLSLLFGVSNPAVRDWYHNDVTPKPLFSKKVIDVMTSVRELKGVKEHLLEKLTEYSKLSTITAIYKERIKDTEFLLRELV